MLLERLLKGRTVCLLGLCLMPTVAAALEVEAIRVGRNGGLSRIVFDLDSAPEYHAFSLTEPARFVIDLEAVAAAATLARAELGKTPIADLRQAAQGDGVHRYVLDLTQPLHALSIHTFVLAPDAFGGHRLVVDVRPAVGEATSEAVAEADAPPAEPEPPVVATQVSEAASAESLGPSVSQPEAEQTVAEQTVADTGAATPWISGQLDLTWEHEAAISDGGLQKFESLLQPAWYGRIGDAVDVTAIARLRADTEGELGPSVDRPVNYSKLNGPIYNRSRGELSLRELYVDFSTGPAQWRVGKQQVVWGQADGIKVLDRVNPQSWREFILDDFDDSRIPLWTVAVDTPIGESGNLQWLWIPDTTYHELAESGTPFAFTSPRLVPALPGDGSPVAVDYDKPDDPLADSDAGLAYTTFLGGWDLSLNYLYHYADFPVMYQDLDDAGRPLLRPRYERNHLVGATGSTALGSLIVRSELAYSTNAYHLSRNLTERGVAESTELAAVLGLDWQMNGDHLLSAQWFVSHLGDVAEDQLFREQTEQTVSLLWRGDFANGNWQGSALGLYSVNDTDAMLQLKLAYWLRGNVKVWLGADLFSGDANGLFGQYDEQDRILLGLEYGL